MAFPNKALMLWTHKQKIKGEIRRKHICTCLERGITNQNAILEYLAEFDIHCSQKTISQDIRVIKKEWREERADTIEALVDREDRKLEALERECWAAWERSQEDSKSKKTKLQNPARQGDQMHGGPRVMEVEVTRKERDGDVQYLQLVAGCIAQRRSMFGLDKKDRAPSGPTTQVNVQVNGATPKFGNVDSISLEQFRNLSLQDMHNYVQQELNREISASAQVEVEQVKDGDDEHPETSDSA